MSVLVFLPAPTEHHSVHSDASYIRDKAKLRVLGRNSRICRNDQELRAFMLAQTVKIEKTYIISRLPQCRLMDGKETNMDAMIHKVASIFSSFSSIIEEPFHVQLAAEPSTTEVS